MCDVVFVVPSYSPTLFEDYRGTMLLATILKQQGLSVHIHNYYEVDMKQDFAAFLNQTVETILSHQPKIVSFYCRCDCYLSNLLLAKALKEANPELYIVFGGPQADASDADTLAEIPWVDFCCRGEGETTVYPLFSALLGNSDYSDVKGLSYRDSSGRIIRNDPPALVDDLDTLPYIDCDFLSTQAVQHALTYAKPAAIEVGRGCPFNCAYCSSSLFWKRKFRLKSAQRIVGEMTEMYNKFGIKNFIFQHDLFTVNKRKVLEFTQAVDSSGIDFLWACSCRVDTLDEETIAAMAKSGLRAVFIGVESGSERMQKSMNKNLKIQDVINVVSALRKHNVKVTASFIYALPEETMEDLEKTLQLAYQLHQMGVQKLQFHLCVIFPGTEYYNRYADELVLSTTQSDIVGDFGFLENQDFIRDHQKLFSFCYEYQSELRNRFSRLSAYIPCIFQLYDKFNKYMPDEFSKKPLTELALEIMDLYEDAAPPKQLCGVGVDYASRYLSGDHQKKAVAAFAYLSDYLAVQNNPAATTEIKKYGVDITAVAKEKPFAEIEERDCFVVFQKNGQKISVTVKAV